jgi:hypothetical protein
MRPAVVRPRATCSGPCRRDRGLEDVNIRRVQFAQTYDVRKVCDEYIVR